MKVLAFLLLLDYSGSMDQVLSNKAKIESLKEETNALISTAKTDSESVAIVFGTHPEKACHDLTLIQGESSKVRNSLQKLKPGILGKTPLAAGLREMSRQAISKNIDRSVVVTDGADSCGEDPCKALKDIDKELGKSAKKLQIMIIGFDLKSDKSKFQCLKNLHLKNVDIALAEAGSGSDLRNKLKENQANEFEQGEKIQDKDTKRIPGLAKNEVNKKGTHGHSDKNSNDKNPPGFDPKTEALLEVVGAPAEAHFFAKSNLGGQDWLGPYQVTLKAGDYFISFDDKNGTKVQLTLGAGTRTKIPWARLMKMTNSTVQVQSPGLNLKWTPSEATKAVHGDVAEFTTHARLNESEMDLTDVPFGSWQMEVTSPPWLKGALKGIQVEVALNHKKEINLRSLFQEQIKWIENPSPNQNMVMKIQNKDGPEETHLIFAGQKTIPILKDAKVEWLYP